MKKPLLNLLSLVFLALTFTGCSKDDDNDPTPATASYNPLTVGTNWTYTATEGNSAPATFKLTVTNKDTTAGTRTYKVLTNTAGQNNYMANSGNSYYRLASYPTFGINNFEDLYLVDNKNVNETWTSTASFSFSGLPLTATLLYTIKEKGITRTVSGKNYTDVIHVRLDLSVTNFGNVGGGDFYYANGVGMIENTILITPPLLLGLPNYNYKQLLTASEIK